MYPEQRVNEEDRNILDIEMYHLNILDYDMMIFSYYKIKKQKKIEKKINFMKIDY